MLVFLVIGLTMNWILTNDSEQIRADVSEFINDIKGVTPTPTPSPTPTPTNTPTPTPTNTPTDMVLIPATTQCLHRVATITRVAHRPT